MCSAAVVPDYGPCAQGIYANKEAIVVCAPAVTEEEIKGKVCINGLQRCWKVSFASGIGEVRATVTEGDLIVFIADPPSTASPMVYRVPLEPGSGLERVGLVLAGLLSGLLPGFLAWSMQRRTERVQRRTRWRDQALSAIDSFMHGQVASVRGELIKKPEGLSDKELTQFAKAERVIQKLEADVALERRPRFELAADARTAVLAAFRDVSHMRWIRHLLGEAWSKLLRRNVPPTSS